MNYQVQQLNKSPKSLERFHKLYFISFPDFYSQLDAMSISRQLQKESIIFNHFVKPAIEDDLILILMNDHEYIGYEFVTVSPFDETCIVGAFTYIVPEHRGKKLSFMLRQKMLELIKKQGIKKFFFTIANKNIVSNNNLQSFIDKFKVQEVAKIYSCEL